MRQALYRKSREKFRRDLCVRVRRIPATDHRARMAALAAATKKHSAALNPPAHPEAEWLHPLTARIHALWLRVRDQVTTVRSASAIRYFVATVVHELGQPRGMVVGSTTVLAPHAECAPAANSDLDADADRTADAARTRSGSWTTARFCRTRRTAAAATCSGYCPRLRPADPTHPPRPDQTQAAGRRHRHLGPPSPPRVDTPFKLQ